MKQLFRILSLGLLGVILFSACSIPAGGTKPVSSMDAIQTAAWQTLAVSGTEQAKSAWQTQNPGLPTLEMTPLFPGSTVVQGSLVPTNTAFPTQTAYPSLTSLAPTLAVPCDRAAWVKDITVPDGTVFGVNTSFVKTWRLRNDGTCTWTTSYKLVFVNGDAMSAPASIALTDSVAPGQEVELSVPFVSPAVKGTYKSNWKLQNASGVSFGLGNANQTFFALINVSIAATPFAVTRVMTSASPGSWNAACPFTITLSAEITATTAGTVTYFWERSDGERLPKHSVTFTEAGTKTITEELTAGSAGYSFAGTYRVYIDEPNHQYFTPVVNLSITCQ